MTSTRPAIARMGIAAVLTIIAASAADAGWSRRGTVVGPRGNAWSYQASGACAGGTCSRSGSVTGPHGRTVTGSASGSCAGNTCTGTRTITGPNGHSVTQSGTIVRY
jgi:hypothetical protein